MQCPLCRENSANIPAPTTMTLEVGCPNCGSFQITTQATRALQGYDSIAFDLASWVYGQTQLGGVPKVEASTIDFIRAYPRPTTRKRAELYLGRVIKMLGGKLMGRFEAHDAKLRVASWCHSNEDAVALAIYLVELEALERPQTGTQYKLVVKGHVLYDEMVVGRVASSQVFVAMAFDKTMTELYDKGFFEAITGAGYAPLRIDRKDHDEKIDDQIIAEIRRSAFMVADFTKHRAGVYYEAGFAHGLGRRVLFTCKSNELKDLHFDVRQYNTIPWDTPQDLVAPLQNRILALFGAGLHKPDAKPLPV
ncbi:MAG: hypothetical protein ABSE69_15980 [Roseiarcus sp.]|jgi:hypothetical protein